MSRALYDLEITRGDSVVKTIEITTDSGPIDLTGKTVKAQVRPRPESETLLASFACSIDAATNVITISLTADQTDAINPGVHAYDVFLVGDDFSKCYLAGRFIVAGRVTDADVTEVEE